jgi:ankyrin repeat protein
MNLPPPPQDDDPIITQFKPAWGQWELNDDNINRIDPETGGTILHNYCDYINATPLEVYRYLIEAKGCDINVQDNNDDTPLHRALYHFNPIDAGGNIIALTYLLSQKNISLNIAGQDGHTLFHEACRNINELPLEIFKLLIETHGCDVNAQSKTQDTPIHLALFYLNPNDGGDFSALTYLLTQENIRPNIKGWHGETLLHMACKHINDLPLDIFELMIETHGFDVNAQNEYNDTPIHQAFDFFQPNDRGDITVLASLINQKNVNVNIKGQDGYTLLHDVCISRLSNSWDSEELNAKTDTILCQIVEVIAERCVQQVLDETTS